MAHAEKSIVIDRPVAEVYEFLLDGSKNREWRPAVLEIAPVPGKPAGVGAVYKQSVKGPGGRPIAADYEILEARPNELIRFQVIAGPARPTGIYRLTGEGSGTRVLFSLHYEPQGLARLMDPMVARTMQNEVGTLANLKAVLERRPA